VEFYEGAWPLLVHVSPKSYDRASLDLMQTSFERYFERGQKYALITCSPRGSHPPGAQERKAIAEWANSPRIREYSRLFCVGSASVVDSALMRGALTAMMWIWTPASPHKAVATLDEAFDYTLEKLENGAVPLPRGPNALRVEITSWLRPRL
jgi:hypothetical protein